MTTRNKRLLFGIGSASLVAVAVMGAVHVPAVRTALGLGGCPWDPSNSASAAKLEENRAKVADQLRGTTPAKARPAFGFALEKTTKADALAWSEKNGLVCKEVQRGLALDCESEPKDVFFRFDTQGVLVELDVMHAPVSPAEAAAKTAAIAEALTNEAGEPTTKRGVPTEEHLSQGKLAQASFEFRFTDYAADVSATSRGEQGVVVRERYRALAVTPQGERQASR